MSVCSENHLGVVWGTQVVSMKRSFGFGGDMGGGRPGGGSAQLLRSIQRVYKAGGEGIYRLPLNSRTTTSTAGGVKYGDDNNKAGSSNSTLLILSSNTSPRNTTGGSVFASTWPSCPSPSFSEDSDWECVIDIDNHDAVEQPCTDDVIFGRTPSSDEVRRAFYSLQGFLELAETASTETSIYNRPKNYSDKDLTCQVSSPTGSLIEDSSFGAEQDWEEPSLSLYNSSWSPSRISQGDVYEALNLVQKDSHIQQIIESLSTDEAVWDAVKNNKVVRELRRAYYQADDMSDDGSSNGSSVDSNGETDIISRLVNRVKSKIMEIMQNMTRILDGMLNPPTDGGGGEGEEDKNGGAERNYSDDLVGKVKVSLFITFMVFLMVVLQRMKHAGNSTTF